MSNKEFSKREAKWQDYLYGLVEELFENGWIKYTDLCFLSPMVYGEEMLGADFYYECAKGFNWEAKEMVEKKTNCYRNLVDQIYEAGDRYYDLAVWFILECKKAGYML